MACISRHARFGGWRRGPIFAPKEDALISAVRILKSPAHFHFDFVDERLALDDLRLDLAHPAQQRAEFARPPADEGRLVFSLKMMPAAARLLQTRHRGRAIRRCPRAQRCLIDQHQSAPERVNS
jgi:hypothetical protein